MGKTPVVFDFADPVGWLLSSVRPCFRGRHSPRSDPNRHFLLFRCGFRLSTHRTAKDFIVGCLRLCSLFSSLCFIFPSLWFVFYVSIVRFHVLPVRFSTFGRVPLLRADGLLR